jgi:hypothetical protein
VRFFPGTRVPARVVLTYFAETVEDLEPSLRTTVDSWRTDEDGVQPEIVYYNDAAARAFLVRFLPDAAEAWDVLVPAAFKADVFRACEIYVRGGLYCDIKCTRIAPYSSLIGFHGTVTVERNEQGLWNGCFAAPPGAPWVGATVVRALDNVRARTYATGFLDITGPTVMGRAFCAFVGRSDATGSCEFLRADVQRGEPGADWNGGESGVSLDWGGDDETGRDQPCRGRGLRILGMRASNSDFFDVVSGPGCSFSRSHVAFKTGNRAYVQSRRAPDPVSNYGFAFENNLVYYPLPPPTPLRLSASRQPGAESKTGPGAESKTGSGAELETGPGAELKTGPGAELETD